MRTIAKLFGRSPFLPLQTHMEKVAACVEKVPELFDAVQENDYKKVGRLSKKISKLENAADVAKNEIRNNLPKGLFLPVDRGHLLEILGLQDDIADKSEDIGVLLTLSNLKMHEVFISDFELFLAKNIESFTSVHRIIQELDELMEYSFGGNEADKVKQLVHKVSFSEHEVDVVQRKLLKKLFANESKFTVGSFHLWLQIFDNIAALSNISENLANRIRMTLELK